MPTTETHDAAGYFDLSPVDLGEDVRREIVLALEAMGFHVEAAHHEVAPGQHEIDFRYDDVLTTADNISTFRFVVKNVAIRNGLHATFMPKPIYGINGSGMHTHMSLFSSNTNIFYDAKAPMQLSQIVPELHRRHPAPREGLLRDHQPAGELVQAARARLRSADQHRVVGEEPQSARARAGGARHRRRESSCACPIRRATRTWRWRSCCAPGLDGIEKKVDPGPPINKNIFTMSHRERRHLRIDELPGNLSEALDELEKDDLVRDTLGEHTLRALRRGQARGVARLHQARLAVGGRAVPRGLLRPEVLGGSCSVLGPYVLAMRAVAWSGHRRLRAGRRRVNRRFQACFAIRARARDLM